MEAATWCGDDHRGGQVVHAGVEEEAEAESTIVSKRAEGEGEADMARWWRKKRRFGPGFARPAQHRRRDAATGRFLPHRC